MNDSNPTGDDADDTPEASSEPATDQAEDNADNTPSTKSHSSSWIHWPLIICMATVVVPLMGYGLISMGESAGKLSISPGYYNVNGENLIVVYQDQVITDQIREVYSKAIGLDSEQNVVVLVDDGVLMEDIEIYFCNTKVTDYWSVAITGATLVGWTKAN